MIKFSIVLCTYNGAKKIEKSLRSILAQNYPRKDYEVIVVDDGSTDETAKVVKRFPVEYHKHKSNLGLAAARNTGLRSAKGKILICYDDDCTADEDWLKFLAKGYENDKVIGVGGTIKLPKNPTFADEYCFQTGYGQPVPMTLGRSTNIVSRWVDYLETSFVNPQSKFKFGDQVRELPGILSSFKKECLEMVGGWDVDLVNVSEDTDLCRRLAIKFPGSRLVVVPQASVIHEQKLSFWNFIKKEYKRGRNRRAYYQISGKFPPVYPGLFFCMLVIAVMAFINFPLWGVLSPLIVYPWWFIRFFDDFDLRKFIFAYMQFFHESATILGMI